MFSINYVKYEKLILIHSLYIILSINKNLFCDIKNNLNYILIRVIYS